jgi:hypothetical protein
MKPGDVVEVEIDGGIGVLRNPPNTTCQETGCWIGGVST